MAVEKLKSIFKLGEFKLIIDSSSETEQRTMKIDCISRAHTEERWKIDASPAFSRYSNMKIDWFLLISQE